MNHMNIGLGLAQNLRGKWRIFLLFCLGLKYFQWRGYSVISWRLLLFGYFCWTGNRGKRWFTLKLWIKWRYQLKEVLPTGVTTGASLAKMHFKKAISVVQWGALTVIDKVKNMQRKSCSYGLWRETIVILEDCSNLIFFNLRLFLELNPWTCLSFFKFSREIIDLSKTCLFSDDGLWFRIGFQMPPVIFQLRFVKKWPGTVFSYFSSSYSFIFYLF